TLGDARVFFQIGPELLVYQALDDALDLGVTELALVLTVELWVRDLGADDGAQAFAGVFTLDGLRQVLGGTRRLGEVVERARERSLKAHEVRAAVVGVDVVGE